jgi:hypothetical protein
LCTDKWISRHRFLDAKRVAEGLLTQRHDLRRNVGQAPLDGLRIQTGLACSLCDGLREFRRVWQSRRAFRFSKAEHRQCGLSAEPANQFSSLGDEDDLSETILSPQGGVP